jgi:hypothetical protein
MPLSKKQLQDKCLLWSGSYKRCRYLAQDDNDWSKWYCLKLTAKKAEIDVETEEFIKDTRKKGQDPKKANIPLGDNCQGYPILKFIEQGYDIP